MTRVLLVGCGNIGSRHLQGLAKLNKKLEIEIVEPNKLSQKIGKIRLREIKSSDNHKINWFENLEMIKDSSDLAIIATQATNRTILINKLLQRNYKKFLIEKVVCQSSKDYQQLLREFKNHNAKGWVNTSRRYFSSYQNIRNRFPKQERLHFSIIGGNLGLGSNAIHYLDLFEWFSNEKQIFLNGDFLSDKLYKNKRGNHLIEFAGTILGTTNSGSTMNITFLPWQNIPLTVEICTKNQCILIDETNCNIYDYHNNRKSKFNIDFQSNLTNKIVTDILKFDKCKLPSLEESYFLHKEIFRIFLKHLKKIKNKNLIKCPIT